MVHVLIHKSSESPVKCIPSLAAGLTHVLGSSGVNVHCSRYPQPLTGPWVPNTSPGYCFSGVQNPNTPHQMPLLFSPLWPSWSTWSFSSFSVNQWEVWLCIHLLPNWGTCHPRLHPDGTQSYAGQIPCFHQVKDPAPPQQNPLNHLNSTEMSLSRSIYWARRVSAHLSSRYKMAFFSPCILERWPSNDRLETTIDVHKFCLVKTRNTDKVLHHMLRTQPLLGGWLKKNSISRKSTFPPPNEI